MSVELHIADKIIEISKDIQEYLLFEEINSLGIVRGQHDMSYSKALLFSWIKGALGGRKT